MKKLEGKRASQMRRLLFSYSLGLYLKRNTKAASLAVFRVFFGLIMTISTIRFWYNGWIEKLYINPSFHFHYSGFELITVPEAYIHFIFLLCGLCAFFVAIGYRYRLAIILFFLSFTYIELLDKTTYLNHYYFVSVVSFILIWLPANVAYSIDSIKDVNLRAEYVPTWMVDVLKLMLAIVYIYAGMAKLNPDWMYNAMPLTIWLPTKFDVPLLGSLMHVKWMHYLFSWGGAIYDLTIVFFLSWPKTRKLAFIAVILFHVMTRVLFPIGMFPYIMICGTLIFFSAGFHEKLMTNIFKLLRVDTAVFKNNKVYLRPVLTKISVLVLAVFMVFQTLFPLRGLIYPGNLFWTEQGYRFSWRVMLMEKTGYANFKIVDGVSGSRFYVQNDDFLTVMQEKQMSTQPDFILEYGQYLGKHFSSQGHKNVEVYVESYASLNGRRSQVFIDPAVDLMEVDYSTLCNLHIYPLNE